MPVAARDDSSRLLGMVTLSDLLAGRLRDLREARECVRTLRVARPRQRKLAAR
jgi:CIC family chloride channel protein